MPVATRIEIPMKDFDPRSVEERIKTYCKSQHGYNILGECSCNNSNFGVEKRKSIGNNGKKVREEVEILYAEDIRCLHFGNGGEGLAFVIESYGIEGRAMSLPIKSSPTIIVQDDTQENPPERILNSVRCYAYGDKLKGNESRMNFLCGYNRTWNASLATPSILKEVNLDIGDEVLVADGAYESLSPKMLNLYEGCFRPRDLSKHLANLDVTSLIGILQNRDVNKKEENAIEELVFGYMGYPLCWGDNPKLRFVSQRPVEYDVSDEGIPEDGDIDKFIEYLETVRPRK